MEDPHSPFSSSFYYIHEGIEEYQKKSLLYTTFELEKTIFSVGEELARKDEELMNLKNLLTYIAKERDETISKCEVYMLENMLLLQQRKLQKNESSLSNGSFSFEEDEIPLFSLVGLCSSASDDNAEVIDKIELRNPLPEKGKLLEAVIGAGPLLQTLLVAGPLPQWQNPPPHLTSVDIPPPATLTPRSSPFSGVSAAVKGGCFN